MTNWKLNLIFAKTYSQFLFGYFWKLIATNIYGLFFYFIARNIKYENNMRYKI